MCAWKIRLAKLSPIYSCRFGPHRALKYTLRKLRKENSFHLVSVPDPWKLELTLNYQNIGFDANFTTLIAVL